MGDSVQGAGGDVFGAIAAPVRRSMLDLLSKKETQVTELASSFDMTLSAVSQHLAILRDAGLVSQRKEGRMRFYRTSPEPLRAVSKWIESYEEFWTDKLNNLGTYLEESR